MLEDLVVNRNEYKNIQQPFSVICVQNDLHVHTIFGPICEHIQTNALLSVQYVEKRLPASTIERGTRVCIQAKRSLSVVGNSRLVGRGVAAGVLLVQTH